jgi:hypothetical protein
MNQIPPDQAVGLLTLIIFPGILILAWGVLALFGWFVVRVICGDKS